MSSFSLFLAAAVCCYMLAEFLFILRKRVLCLVLLGAGIVLHAVFLVSRGWTAGIFLPNGIFENVFLLPWALAAAVLILSLAGDRTRSWESGVILVCLFAVFALVYPKGIIPPTPNKLTPWAQGFFLSEVAGHACFFLAGWYALLDIRKDDTGGRFHSLLIWGFLFYSLSQVVGAVWAYQGWAGTFRWGSRHLQSAVIWCYYAAYLHLRFMPRWGGKRRSWYAVAGFFVVMLCSFGSYIHEMNFPRIGGE